MQVHSNNPAAYNVTPIRPTHTRAELVVQALAMLDAELRTITHVMADPGMVKNFLCLHNGQHEDQHIERFSVMWLDSQNALIGIDTLFTGTLTQTSVYPREVVRAALRHNAAACVLSHNHPSGLVQPSRADESLTAALKSALALVDVRVLDHIITSGSQSFSFAEKGLL